MVSPGRTVKVWPLGSSRTSRPAVDGSGKGMAFSRYRAVRRAALRRWAPGHFTPRRGTPAALAAAAELALDHAARLAWRCPPRGCLRAWQEQQRDGDEVRHHAGEDQEQARDDGARAVGQRSDRELSMRETGGKARQHRETRLLDERHAGARGEDHPRE